MAINIKFSYNYRFRLREKLNQLEQYCDEVFEEIVEEAKANCPSKTVASKISFIRDGRAKGRIVVDHPAALPIEYGSKPHIIRPKNFGGVLRWKSNENRKNVHKGFAYATEVNHPGTKEAPFLRPAIDSARQKIEDYIRTL